MKWNTEIYKILFMINCCLGAIFLLGGIFYMMTIPVVMGAMMVLLAQHCVIQDFLDVEGNKK
jgi:hypothetical protein